MRSAGRGKPKQIGLAKPFRDPRETEFNLNYCYPSVLFDDDRLHVTYYGPGGGQQFILIYQPLPATWFDQ